MTGTFLDVVTQWPDGPLLVGFSGGLDSSALLHALAARDAVRARGLRAIHVNHGLHPDAYRWAEHCRSVCHALAVELDLIEVQVAQDSGIGREAAARHARYAAFAAQLRNDEILVLAHHRDDQAETVLLRLLRASGSDGLAAMRERRQFGNAVLWRPLLQVSRAELLAYASANGLNWLDDPSNDDHSLDRNFLRHQVLPLLLQRWPQATASLARSAALLDEDAALLREECQRRLASARGPDLATLDVPALLALSSPWRARVLRLWLAELGLPPLPGAAIAVIDSDLLQARPDANARYCWGGFAMSRWGALLHVAAQEPPMPADWMTPWDGADLLILPTGDALSFVSEPGVDEAVDAAGLRGFAAQLGMVSIGARRGGERITLPGRKHSHALKQLLQEAAMPPWLRRRLPVMTAGDGTVLAAGDRFVSVHLQQLCRQHQVRLHWHLRDESDAAPD